MTWDEQAEFLRQSIESHDRQIGELTESAAKNDRQIGKLIGAIEKLVVIAEAH